MQIARRLKKLVDSNTIQKEAEKRYEHLLTPSKIDINWLNKYVASKLYYLRAQENIQAAALFSAQGLSEDVFNEYLALTPVDNPAHIPDIHIDGKEISDAYQGYYLKKLSSFNPEAAYLGRKTSCCQSLDHASGKEPTIYGITSEYAGFYAIYKKARTALEKDIVVAQSLAWRNGIMMLDSEESQMDVKKHYEIMLADFAVMLAHRLVKMGAVPAVYIGHGNTPSMLTKIKALAFVNPVDYEGYRDSRVQYVVADKHLPFVLYYALRNKNSALASHPNDFLPEVPLTNEQIDRFCEALFTEGDAVDIIFSVYPEIKDEMLKHRNRLTKLEVLLRCTTEIPPETFKHFFEVDKILPNVRLDKSGNTPLSLFAHHKRWELVKWLIELGADPNTIVDHYYRHTLLHFAAKERDMELVKWLIKHGADMFGFLDADGQSPFDYLHDVSPHSGRAKTFDWEFDKWLFEHFSNNAKSSKYQLTLLHFAIRYGQLDTAKWMVAKGNLFPLALSDVAFSLLQAAAMSSNVELVKWLIDVLHIEHLLLTKVRDKTFIAVVISASAHASSDKSNIELINMIEFLITKGVDPQDKGKNNTDALFYAMNREQFDVAEFLIKKGADIHQENDYGCSRLHEAADTNRCENIKFLLDNGALLDSQTNNSEKRTPLHIAIASRMWNTANYLVEHDANLAIADAYGLTALDLLKDLLERESFFQKKEKEALLLLIQQKLKEPEKPNAPSSQFFKAKTDESPSSSADKDIKPGQKS